MNQLGGVSFPVLSERDTRRGRRKSLRKNIVKLGIIILIPLTVAGAVNVVQRQGRAGLDRYAASLPGPATDSLRRAIAEAEPPGADLPDYVEPAGGQVLYNGRLYEYNEDILTFLLLGIDSREGIGDEKMPVHAGQADVIVLLVFDERTKDLTLINVPRDTMAPVAAYFETGEYAGIDTLQLATQYGYGDGRWESIRLMNEAVSNLFYGIPIHGHAALELQGIAPLNDTVGGVTLTVAEDLTARSPRMAVGDTITLTGDEAMTYIRYREWEPLDANDRRNLRQMQYMAAYFDQVKRRTKGDIFFPLKLYNAAQPHAVTSVTPSQAAYLAGAAIGSGFTADDMVSLSGTNTRPDTYLEFHVDEDALLLLIIETFYRIVI